MALNVAIANRVIRGTVSSLSAFLISLMAFKDVVSAEAPAPDTAPMPISDQVAEGFYSSVSSPETILSSWGCW